MDPVKVFSLEVVEMIFNNLSSKEVLNFTLVSQQWNNAIGASLKCMDKLSLKIKGKNLKNFNDEEKEILKTSRNFSKIDALNGTTVLPIITDILSFRFHWKSVNFYCTEFESTSDFLKLFKTFESTVEHVGLHQIKIKTANFPPLQLEMTKLKSLSISNCDTNISTAVLDGCSSLQSLDLGFFPTKTDSTSLTASIRKFTNLKKLTASSNWYNIFFDDTKPELEFQLESLKISSNINFDDEESFMVFYRTQKCFYKFLEKQTNSLTNLQISGLFGIEVIRIAFRMKNLRVLAIPDLSMLSLPRLDFVINPSIKNLDIASIGIRNKDLIKEVIKCVPNLKALKI